MEGRIPLPFICRYRLRDMVGRAMTIVSQLGASKPSVKTLQFVITFKDPGAAVGGAGKDGYINQFFMNSISIDMFLRFCILFCFLATF